MNLIWREVERKNYYKAQDHQVIAFKSNEKSLLKGQNLLKEIHDLKKDRRTLVYTVSIDDEDNHQDPSKQSSEPCLNSPPRMDIDKDSVQSQLPSKRVEIMLESKIPEQIERSPNPTRATHQVELGFNDMDAFFDALRIIIMALDRSTLSNPERRRIDESLRTFIPAVWNISATELEKQIPIIYDDDSSEPSEYGRPTQPNMQDSQAVNPQNVLDQKGIQTLTEGLLKIQTNQESRTARSQNLDTPMSSPQPSYQLTPAEYSTNTHAQPAFNEPNEACFTGLKKWTKLSAIENLSGMTSDTNSNQPVDCRIGRCYNVFGSSTYYLLVRLLHTLYMRLIKLKRIGMELGKQKPRWRRINPVAIELGLSHSIIGLDDHPNPSSQLYPYCLDQLSRYFDNEIDFHSFEESIRVAFPRDGYLLSTVDKLTNSILKQFAQIHQEPKNKELLNLLNRERALNSISPITQISYRHQAQSILEEGEGELYRAEWHPERMSLSFQILHEGEPTFEVKTPTDRLTHYIDTYEFETSTELIDPSKVRRPFLRSNLIMEEESEAETNEADEENNNKSKMSGDTTSGMEESKNGKQGGRQVLMNVNQIRLSIDPKTYKLQFNGRKPRAKTHDDQTDLKPTSSTPVPFPEPTDILFVRDLSSPSRSPLSPNLLNLQSRKFHTWLEKRLRELNDLDYAPCPS